MIDIKDINYVPSISEISVYIENSAFDELYQHMNNEYKAVCKIEYSKDVWDDYETDYTIFNVCGNDIRVYDDELAEALKKLPERKRNTLLMYYFLEMTESEIANLQKITQSGVFRNRHHALETMKKILKEEH